jgi:hypothetical protein
MQLWFYSFVVIFRSIRSNYFIGVYYKLLTMSASNLFNINGDLSLLSAISTPAIGAVLTASYSSLVVVTAGKASVALGAGAVTIPYAGLLATDIVFCTVGQVTTPANAGVACSGYCTAGNLVLQSAFATTAEVVNFLVYRPNA